MNSIEIEEGGEEVTPAATAAGGAIPKQLPRKKKSFDLNSQTDRLWQVSKKFPSLFGYHALNVTRGDNW